MNKSSFIITLNPVDWLTISATVSVSTAIFCALHGWHYLAIAILFLAMLGDALDGILARKYQLERPFGRYLDGFMDQLLYLFAPALILFLHGFEGGWALFLLPLIACGSIRLSVFNEIGNIQDGSNSLSYLGMPVFWSLPILAGYALLMLWFPALLANLLLAITLSVFSFSMLYRKAFYKFKHLSAILGVTLGGGLGFLLLHLWSLYAY